MPDHEKYVDILPQQPALAQESALEQESETSGATRNLKAYKLAIHQAAVSVSRRPRPDRIPHPSIGTVKQHRAAAESAKKASASKLTIQRISPYCLDISSFTDWGYPDYYNPSLLDHKEDLSVAQTCDRCKSEFSLATTYELGDCVYHFGKLRPEQRLGRRTWLYTCCGKDRGSLGCEEGVHVFSFKDDDLKLAAQEPFKTTEQVVQKAEPVNRTPLDIVALDCEMIYTSRGSALARVTVVDEDGNQILDEFVRQGHSVLDYNTRYSGVTASDVESAVMDLDAVRTAVCNFVGPDTIVVGHGLENDLRALRLLHPRVVDTAILFPHPKGRPYRLALRDLVKEKLGYFIQGQSDTGHSSLEDAHATVEILRWKVREDPQ